MFHRLLKFAVNYIMMVYPYMVFSKYETRCQFKVVRDVNIFECRCFNLTTIPRYIYSREAHVLNLYYNKISVIRSNDFAYYPNLDKLILRGNNIRSIEENAFVGLLRLRKLDLSENFIRQIHPKCWGSLVSTLVSLSLSMNSFVQLPILKRLSRLKKLNISSNPMLRQIDAGSLPTSLVELDLHYTGVKHISQQLFRNLQDLRKLHLQDMLASSYVTFEEDVFEPLTSLRYLDLSRTFCRNLQANSFNKLKNLRFLRMKSCWLTEIPHLFELQEYNRSKRNFFHPKLKELDLSENRRLVIDNEHQRFPSSLRILSLANVQLRIINSNLLRNMKKLEKLHIHLSKVKKIDKDAFRDLESLQEISLSNNLFESAPSFPQTLRSLNITSTNLKVVTANMMKNLHIATKVNLSSNRIESIEESSFRNLTSLRILDLSNNKLRTLGRNGVGSFKDRSVRRFDRVPLLTLDNLEILDLRHNLLTRLEYDVLRGVRNLVELILKSNQIELIHPKIFEDLGKLEILDLRDNNLTSIANETLQHLGNLKILELSGNELYSMGPIDLPSLQYIDLSYNRFRRLPAWKRNRLKIINVSKNEITSISTESLIGLCFLEEIYLSDNQINAINYESFESTRILTHLDLSKNFIEKFPDFRIPNLQVLRLSENPLREVSLNIEDLFPLLKILELRHNHIPFINPDIFVGVFSLKRVDFSWNIFECDCTLRPFLNWIDDNRDIIKDEITYLCRQPEFIPMTIVVRNLDCTEYHESIDGAEMADNTDYDMCVCEDE